MIFINTCIDQGDDMLNEIKYNIGKVEVEDQLDVTNQLINLYPFIGRLYSFIGWLCLLIGGFYSFIDRLYL